MKTLTSRFSRIRWRTRVLVVLPILAAAIFGATWSAFSSQTDNTGDSISAAPDYAAPSVSAQSITKAAGGIGGYLAQNSQFYVYANVTDTGNPASGIASVNASGNLPGYGQQSIPLSTTGGPWTVGGVTYNYRSAVNTFPPMAEQTIPLSIDAADNASNSGSTPFNLVIDNTAGSATTVQTANGGATAGRPEAGDSVTYTFSEPVEPISVISTWTDPTSSKTATVTITDGGAGNDTLTVGGANLGTLNLGRTDYVTATRTYTNSTLTVSGNTLKVVLGTASGAGTTAAGNGTMSWASSGAATDRAGNAFSGNTATESGAPDKEF
jgi:hypothetical protein